MPKKNRRAKKRRGRFGTRRLQDYFKVESSVDDNDVELCISNYYKMKKPKNNKSGTSRFERAHWTSTAKIALSHMLLDYKRQEMLSQNNMQSFVCPEIAKKLNLTYNTSFTADQVRSKYYKFMRLTNLYKDLGNRTTGLGWSVDFNIPIMDDDAWESLFKEDPEYAYFKDRRCLHFDMLCEVFHNQGATGKYAQDSTQQPMGSDDEREQANAWRQHGKEKVTVTVVSEDEQLERPIPQSKKNNKGKGKRKTPEQSGEGGPLLQSKRASKAYLNCIEAITSHFSAKPRSSMSGSFVSPPPSTTDDPYGYLSAMKALDALNIPDPDVNIKVGELLKDEQNRIMFLTFKHECRVR